MDSSGSGLDFIHDGMMELRPGLSSHRYSVIFSADSDIFAFSAMFRAEPADFNFDISGHN